MHTAHSTPTRLEAPVAITGCGWVTPFAAGTLDEVLSRLADSGGCQAAGNGSGNEKAAVQAGRSVFAVPEADPGALGDVPKECAREPQLRMTAVALRHAIRAAGLAAESLSSDRTGLAIGCALAGQIGMIDFAEDVRQQSPRFVSPIRFPQTVGNYLAGAIARGFGVRGPGTTVACGAAGGLRAVAEGAAWLAGGMADVVVAGASEVFSPPLATALGGERDPFADAACVFILERKADATARGAEILGIVESAATEAGLLSTADFRQAGALYVEHWTGRSLAASGAAALAAAIGGLAGLAVPIVGPDGSIIVEVPEPSKGSGSRRPGCLAGILASGVDPGDPPDRLVVSGLC